MFKKQTRAQIELVDEKRLQAPRAMWGILFPVWAPCGNTTMSLSIDRHATVAMPAVTCRVRPACRSFTPSDQKSILRNTVIVESIHCYKARGRPALTSGAGQLRIRTHFDNAPFESIQRLRRPFRGDAMEWNSALRAVWEFLPALDSSFIILG